MRPKVEDLFRHSRDKSPSKIKGVSSSFLTKTLHPYARPFLPILDQQAVQAAYGRRPATEYVHKVRRDMRNSSELLTKLQEHLLERGVDLSRVRIFDILLWTRWRHQELGMLPSALFGVA